ncbi:p115 like vesicle tethering protein [Crepidotus variabilis]|uniref:P115 like vesicle tethering protein n=1 Tax=Crepidotus variabilis TaxID=179855 RepID=A0A9P6EIJ3_9AGAR|nr:p115 like vesicle tethering protein [Crepidotus variabilis]
MDFLSQTYVALRGPTGAPQTAEDTIGRLSDRLSPDTLLADRRASVLALKGLSRDHKQEVGERALNGLLEVLYNDAHVDADIGKAVLETLATLCDTEDATPGGKEVGFNHTDHILASDKATHTLFELLVDVNFYTRFATLQFLSILLLNRRQAIQSYFLTAPAGPSSIVAVLEDKREIIRNEAITMVQALVSQSPDIQKVLTFEGAFEKLFNTVTQEGGVDGGVVAQGALACVDSLLRFNSSNQSYFRETPLPPIIFALLQFPSNLPIDQVAPQEFALQFWDEQKRVNVSLILGIIGMLLGSKGHSAQANIPYTRCLVEIALASNAPTSLKTQALRLLPSNLNFPLSEILLTPYIPVPETNGEEWDRLEVTSALDVLVELAIHGEYNGLYAAIRSRDSLELRAAAATVFENFVRNDEIRQAIIQAMLPPENPDPSNPPRTTTLLHALAAPPNTSSALDPADVTSTHIAAMMFSHLLRSSPRVKVAACQIIPGPLQPQTGQASSFFVPADGGPPPAPVEADKDDDDETQTLLHTLTENLSLSMLSRSRSNTSDREAREWDRYVVGYLCLLSQWLWEDPKSVRGFLDAGGLGVLVEPINQTSEMDTIVPGLCAFLLGVCYEFNREPGEITRKTIYPILNRLSVETLVGQMTRFREDERFKAVGPDSIVLPHPLSAHQPVTSKVPHSDESEIWLDWAFIDFWKSNYYTVQRGFSTEHSQLSSSGGQNAEAQMLIASLRDVIRQQSNDIEDLQKKLKTAIAPSSSADTTKLSDLQKKIDALQAELTSSEEKRKEVEKEQEDLLVLLDEVTNKRKKDKVRLKEAGLEVSEDDDDEDDDDDDDDE